MLTELSVGDTTGLVSHDMPSAIVLVVERKQLYKR
jgi:hypothetical protein